jgi:DNA (cytosine-5)-methyltransferase 1
MTAFNHRARKVGNVVQQRIDMLKIGQKMQDLPEELWHPSFKYYVKDDPNRQGGPNLRMIRLDPTQPSLTVTGYIFNKFVHPYENRFITPREAARLQGFPDELEFMGSLTSIQQQIGDAVPIDLGRAIFCSVLRFLAQHFPSQSTFPAISLFSGAGGLDVACHQAISKQHSWQTIACVESERDRCLTLENYFNQSVPVCCADISIISAPDILNQTNYSLDEVLLVYGGPPCQAFSQAGKQQGILDERGELIFEFLRFIKDIRPPLFLMENVPNLKSIAKGQLMASILEEMENLGYSVDYRIMNAAEYGSPQKRHRLIFLGTHKLLGKQAMLPTATHTEHDTLFGTPRFKTVGEAFIGLPPATFE